MLCIVSAAAADDQRRFSRGLLRMQHPETDEMRGRMIIQPGNRAFPFLGFAIKGFKPARRVALAVEFVGEFARSRAVSHAARL